MSCRGISLPFLFAIVFWAPAVGVVDSCRADERLAVADEDLAVVVTIKGGRVTCKLEGGFCVCTRLEPLQDPGMGSGRTTAEACKAALDDLKAKIDRADPPGPGKGYYISDDPSMCCKIPGLCPKDPQCPRLVDASYVDSRTSTGCGKYEVRVSCRRCDNRREVSITYHTDHPHIAAIRMRCAS